MHHIFKTLILVLDLLCIKRHIYHNELNFLSDVHNYRVEIELVARKIDVKLATCYHRSDDHLDNMANRKSNYIGKVFQLIESIDLLELALDYGLLT